MSLENITDKAHFKSAVIDADASHLIVVVFTDETEESKSLVEMVNKAAGKASDVKFYQVDMDKVTAAAEKLGTTQAPLTVIYKGGQPVKKMEGGFGGPQLKEAIEAAK